MDIRPMTQQDARAIQAWTYEAPYDFYNQEASAEGLDELMAYQAVHDEALIGFYCLGTYAQVPNDTYVYDDTCVDLGLGMHPDRTGQGHGRTFVRLVMQEAAHEGKPLRLTVAAFNERAIHLYEQLGFRQVTSFEKGATRFLVMTR
ncbi:GNAT family N-acetyltransferase [Exiguobacterium aurantiacum]|uniref:GNAT family N-acetyltransferase n=1 Tax=Exiguobacterium aurantiacum TaxID=33987 RepID=UPI001E544856|nr:GNAT family N-acetyltransferase [Exiguobacterium aurantiacum]